MSRRLLIDPNPLVITISYSEVTSKADFKVSRDVPFITIIAIFAQITMALIQLGAEVVRGALGNGSGGASDGSQKT